jgi:transposase-like protein
MPRKRSTAEVAAEAGTEETRQFVRRVRRATRRKFTPEEKVRVVLEGFRREVPVSELCRREGIRPNVYYSWLKDFMEAASRGCRQTRCGTPHGQRLTASDGRTSSLSSWWRSSPSRCWC